MNRTSIIFVFFFLLLVGCSSSKSALLHVDRTEQEKNGIYKNEIRYGHGLNMTNLWRDSLIISRDTILLNYSPLLDFEGITRAILKTEEETLATFLKDKNEKERWIHVAPYPFNCDREYTASWQIIDNKLYLGKVSPREVYLTKEAFYTFDGPQQIDQRKIDKRIEAATGRKYKNGLLFADWVNGTLSGNIGGERDSEKRMLVIINSPKEASLQIKNGVVQDIQISDCPQ